MTIRQRDRCSIVAVVHVCGSSKSGRRIAMLNKLRTSVFRLMVGLTFAILAVRPVRASSQHAPSAAIVEIPEAVSDAPWADAPLAILYNQYNNPGTRAIL